MSDMTTPTNLRLPTPLREEIDDYVQDTGRTLSGGAARLLRFGLDVEAGKYILAPGITTELQHTDERSHRDHP